MAHVVTGRCQDCCYTDCVEHCPCACFHRIESPDMLVINPDACIDCFGCVDACPVGAIYLDEDVPDAYRSFIALNAERWSGRPVVESRETPLNPLSAAQIKQRELDAGLGEVPDP